MANKKNADLKELKKLTKDDYFISVFKKLCLNEPDWKLRFVGNISESTKSMIKKNELESSVEFSSYRPHHEAIEFMLSSDILLLIIPKLEENKGILTGKIFEYIASGTPIILIGPPDGDAAVILSEFKNVKIIDYSEDIDLSQITKEIISQESDSTVKIKYSRVEQTKKIAELINKI